MIRTSVMAGVVAVALATFAAPAGAWERDGYRGNGYHHGYLHRDADRMSGYPRTYRYERHGRFDGPPPWRRRWAHWHRGYGWGHSRNWW
ncbi:MAG: hypothetical protein ACRCYS_05350 [Beijerinckiaceae bacterium]